MTKGKLEGFKLRPEADAKIRSKGNYFDGFNVVHGIKTCLKSSFMYFVLLEVRRGLQ